VKTTSNCLFKPIFVHTACLALLASSEAQELRPYQILAHGGQAVPGVPDATYGFIEPASIGQGGHVVIHGQVSRVAQPANDYAIITGLPGELELLVRRGMPAPLANPGDVFDSFTRNQLRICPDGTVAFQAILNGIAGPEGVWVGKPGAFAPSFIEGHQAPGFPEGAVFEGNFDWACNGAGGVVALRAKVEGGGAGFGNDFGVWLGSPGALELLAREDHVSQLGPGIIFQRLAPVEPSLNGLGEICFTASMSGSGISLDNNEVLFKGDSPTSLVKVLQESDPMPGLPGRSFDNLSFIIARQRINDNGEIIFATQDRNQEDPKNSLFCVIHPAGDMTVIAEENTPAPDTTDLFGEDFFAQPLLGGDGHAAFDAHLVDVGGVLDIDAIYAVLDDELRLVARAGDPAPGFAPGISFQSLESPAVTDTGFVVFEATTSDNVKGIWGGRRGDLKLIIRAGDQLDVSGVIRRVQLLELARGSDAEPHGGGQDGHESVINDCGQLVFWVQTELEPQIGLVNAIVYVDDLVEKDIDDGDCVPCLLEEAFGTDCSDPTDGVAGLPRIQQADDNAVLQFRRRVPADGFEYLVETSPDGREWFILTIPPIPSADQSGLPPGIQRVEVSVPLSEALMLRVRVIRL
jgi:hypothetical protein